MRQDHYDNTKALLDRWADWKIAQGSITSTAKGYPCESVGAPDARVHSFEDLEIEVEKRIVRAVDTAVWDLPVLEREVINMHYGFLKVKVWRAQFDTVFDLAIESLHKALRNRVAC